jgi:predicted Zn-dependent protease
VSAACGLQADDPLAEIRAMQKQGRVEESVTRLRALLDESPDQPELQLLYGMTLARLGQLNLAVWPLRKAAAAPEFAVDAGLALAGALLQMMSMNDAIAAASDVLAIEPENPLALEIRARAYLGARREEEALIDLDRLLEGEPDHIGALITRTSALLQLGRGDEAAQALQEARTRIATSSNAPPPQLMARLCMAEATFTWEKGEPERARELLEGCVAEYPAHPLVVRGAVEFYDRGLERERGTQILRAALEQAPHRGSFREQLADRLRASGEADEAERLLLEATQREPSTDTWLALFNHYVALEDFEAARSAMEQALDVVDDPDAMLRFAYSDTLIQVGDYRRAEEVAAGLDPVLANLLRGRIHLAEGDAAAAREALEAGVRMWPDNATARWLAGQAAEQMGDFDAAASHYREAVRVDIEKTDAALRLAKLLEAEGRFEGAFEFAGRYARAHPTDVEGYLLGVRLSVQLEREQSVRNALGGLAQLPGQRARAVAEWAALRANAGGPDAAVEFIENQELDLTDPENIDALRALVQYLGAQGEHQRALERAAAALEARPEVAVFHELNARALDASGAADEVVRASFERAVALDPQQASALAGLGRLAAEAGEVDAALALYDRAAEADSDAANYAYAAAQLLIREGKSEEAERRLAVLLVHHPHHAKAADDLARLLVAQGRDLDRALVLAQRAIRFRGGPEAFETLGWVRLERGESESAVEALRHAVELRPESASVQYRLGLALVSVGDEDAARDALRLALEAGDFAEVERAKAELARLEARSAARP